MENRSSDNQIHLATLKSQTVTRSNGETGFVEYEVWESEPAINLSSDPRGYILHTISFVLAHACKETGMPPAMWHIYTTPRVQSFTNLPEKIEPSL